MDTDTAQTVEPKPEITKKKKKFPYISVACCWHCRKWHTSLRAIRDLNGKRTGDYVCFDCVQNFPAPPVRNVSQLYFTPPVEATAGNEKSDGSETENIENNGAEVFGMRSAPSQTSA